MSTILQAQDPRSQYPTEGARYLTTRFVSELSGMPYVKAAENVFNRYTYEVAKAKLLNTWNLPFHNPQAEEWKGTFEFTGNTGILASCGRALWWIGTKCNTIEKAVLDLTAFSQSPGTVAIAAGNIAPLFQAAMMNGALIGIPMTESLVRPKNWKHAIMTDQVYGGSPAVLPVVTSTTPSSTQITAWATGQAYTKYMLVTSNGYVWSAGSTATSGATAPTGTTVLGTASDGTITWTNLGLATNQAAKYVDPTRSDFMTSSAWTTARQNFTITPDNIIQAVIDLQQRRADNGIQLGLATKAKVQIGVPFISYEQTRQIIEVFRQIPGTGVPGVDPRQVAITGGSSSQVIFSVQDNPAFGSADLVAVPGLLPTRWFAAATPPPDMHPARASLFVHTYGGTMGSWQPLDAAQAANPLNGDNVPHIQVIEFPAGANSPMWTGSMPGSVAGDVGVGMFVAEGFAFNSPILFNFFDTGYWAANLPSS